MDHNKFIAITPYIVTELVNMISDKQGISEDDAILKLYSSKLYSLLEQEETKLWQYSTPMLYDLYMQEQTTGKINFPDV